MTKEDLSAVAAYFGGPLAEYLADKIPALARQLNREYSRIPAEDFEQGMWLGAMERQERITIDFNKGDLGFVNRKLRDAGVKLMKEDDRYVRALKAADAGYSIDDEQFYTTGMIAKILPALIEAGFDVSIAMDRAGSGSDAAGIHIRVDDPHGGAEEYLAILLDVSTAWGKLLEGQRRLLRAYFSIDLEGTAHGRAERQRLASSMGITEPGLWSRVHRALQAIQAILGGPSPWT